MNFVHLGILTYSMGYPDSGVRELISISTDENKVAGFLEEEVMTALKESGYKDSKFSFVFADEYHVNFTVKGHSANAKLVVVPAIQVGQNFYELKTLD